MARKELVIIFISALCVTALLVGVAVNNAVQTVDDAEAKIIEFTDDRSFRPFVVGTGMFYYFYVTIQNVGDNNITGAVVTVERITDDGEDTLCTPCSESIAVLRPNETQLIKLETIFDLFAGWEVKTSDFLATLSVNGRVLDERIIKATNSAKVIGFSADGPGASSDGTILWKFNVTIQNKGGNDISGLALLVRMMHKNTIVAESTTQIGALHIEAIREIETVIEGGPELSESEEFSYEVLLTVNDGNKIINGYEFP